MREWKYSVSSADTAPTTAPLLLLGTLEENIEKASKLGYSAIEVHIRENADMDVEKAKAAMAKYNMSISAIVTGRLNTEGGCDLIADEPYITDACIKGMLQYIDMAAQLDTDLILGWARGRIPAGGDSRKYMARMAANLKILDRYAGKKKVKIMIEVINRYEINTFNTADELMTFLEAHDLPNCYAHLDAFHMGIDEVDPYKAIKRCGKRLGYFHLADSTRRYPGTGQFDFSMILTTLAEIDYRGYLSVECLPWPSHMEAAKDALRFLKETERRII